MARQHATPLSGLNDEQRWEMQRRHFVKAQDLGLRIYSRLTDNWLELALRFVCPTHGIRDLKSRMSREIRDGLEQAGIIVASGTYAVVAMQQPP